MTFCLCYSSAPYSFTLEKAIIITWFDDACDKKVVKIIQEFS
jgi:hypothetical protein